ncbi:hypothetical protein Q3G72_035185 [Acer saccharum]|nr:hypothetical protein Q3G72_035185 [Acer saccharum]
MLTKHDHSPGSATDILRYLSSWASSKESPEGKLGRNGVFGSPDVHQVAPLPFDYYPFVLPRRIIFHVCPQVRRTSSCCWVSSKIDPGVKDWLPSRCSGSRQCPPPSVRYPSHTALSKALRTQEKSRAGLVLARRVSCGVKDGVEAGPRIRRQLHGSAGGLQKGYERQNPDEEETA